MASPRGPGVLDLMLLSTTKTSRISEEALSDEDIQQLPMEEDYSQLRRGEKRKRATSENGAETSVVATMFATSQRHVGRSNDTDTELASVNNKIDAMMAMLNDIAPVVKTLNDAYESSLLADSDNENDVDTHRDTQTSTVSDDVQTAQKPADGGQTSNSLSVVDSLVSDVNSEEKTGPAISGKIAKALDSILANGLNEQVLSKRKEGINRPENCTMLTTVRVNPEILDIAKKQTRSIDARLQALQDSLIKGLIPLATMAGKVGAAIDTNVALPPKEELWEALSNASILVAAANHHLNICRRDMFKFELNESYKALCNNKHPVGQQLLGDDFGERLKTLTESNKAARQLTSSSRMKDDSKPFFGKGGRINRPRKQGFRTFQADHHQKRYRQQNNMAPKKMTGTHKQ